MKMFHLPQNRTFIFGYCAIGKTIYLGHPINKDTGNKRVTSIWIIITHSGSAFINLHSMKTVSDVLAMLDHSDQVVNNTQFTGPQEVTPLTAIGNTTACLHLF